MSSPRRAAPEKTTARPSFATGQIPINALVMNSSSARCKLSQSEVALAGRETRVGGRFEHHAPHHAGDAVAREQWRHEIHAADREHVAAAPADDIPARVEQQPLLDVVPAQLDLRKHLLEPAQMLEPCERRRLSDTQLAHSNANAVSVVAARVMPARTKSRGYEWVGSARADDSRGRPTRA